MRRVLLAAALIVALVPLVTKAGTPLTIHVISSRADLVSGGTAVVAVSEGATIIGGGTIESGEADAYGNRKLGGIGGIVSDYLEKRSGDKVIYQRLAYLMRSGAPDSLDQLVANNYGSLAADLMRRGETGKMVAVVDGRYTAVPIEVGSSGHKRVDVNRFYDVNNYRPKVADVMGMPMFLH